MKTVNVEEIKALTGRIIHNTFVEGDYELWYSCLYRDSVFICNGEPILIGDVAIRSHFDNLPKIKSVVRQIELHAQGIGESGASVYGKYVLCTQESKVYATIYFSVTFQFFNNKPKIILEHFFYDYHVQKFSGNKDALTIDLKTVDFVRTLLLNIVGSRIEIKSGSHTLFVDPSTILYIDSRRNKTEFVCVDRSVSCNQSIKEVQKLLPDYFYPLRRGNLVNLKYVVELRRFELEMISGITIPIPERNYPRIKTEISDRILTLAPIQPKE